MSEDRLEKLSERLLELHEALDFYGHDTDEYDIDAIEEAESLIQSQAMELEALRTENARLRTDASRYQHLRNKDLSAISDGGVFAGMTPNNTVLNEGHLDLAVDIEINALSRQALKTGEVS